MKKTFTKLYEKSSTGKIKYWSINVTEFDDHSDIIIRFGVDGEKERTTTKTIKAGKNVGKSNETTHYKQACLEAQSAWNKKLDSGYITDKNELNTPVLLPMLAHMFEKRKHDIIYPCYVQPKLDGVRCLVAKIDDVTIKYFSRGGKPILTLEHLTPDLLKLMKTDDVWDGEIYDHTISFQTIVSYMKKIRLESATLAIWFFDKVDTKKDFEDRYNDLKTQLANNKNKLIKLVEVHEIKNVSEVKIWHDKFVQHGFEGCMIRNKLGEYKLKDRSANLLKYKTFIDEEFEIVSGYSGLGTEEGAVTFVCKTKEGKEFGVRPRGSIEHRRKQMLNIKSLIGQHLTVRYQEMSDENVPRFPVGIIVREEYE